MSERQAAVDRYAGSYMNRLGSSSRNALLGNTPSVMGTVTVFPVRSSVIVMVSGTWFPSSLTGWWGLPPRSGTLLPATRSGRSDRGGRVLTQPRRAGCGAR